MAPANWTTTNLSPAYLAEDNSAPLFATCIAFLVIDTFFIILLYTARSLTKEGKTKASILTSLLMTGAYTVCVAKITVCFLMIHLGGAGHHLMTLPVPIVTNLLKLTITFQILCPLTTSLTKLGILILMHQIFGRTSRWSRFVIKTTFAAVLAITIIQLIIPFANCKPFSRSWQPSGPGHCVFNEIYLWRYLTIPNTVMTIVIVIIPLPALYKLRVSAPVKLGLGVILSVCLLGVVAAIMRFQSFFLVTSFNDISYEAIKPLCWTIAESGIYLAAGVLPTLWPLLMKLFHSIEFVEVFSRRFGSWENKRWSKIGGNPVPYTMEMGSGESS